MKKSVISLTIALSMLFGINLTSCAKKPQDLESFIKNNEEVKQEIESAADTAGLSVDIKGNVVTYSYDLATIEGVEEETIREEAMIETLQSTLDSQSESFVGLCKKLEEQTGFTGIQMVVNYTYGSEVLATQTFTSAGSAGSGTSEKSSEADSESADEEETESESE